MLARNNFFLKLNFSPLNSFYKMEEFKTENQVLSKSAQLEQFSRKFQKKRRQKE